MTHPGRAPALRHAHSTRRRFRGGDPLARSACPRGTSGGPTNADRHCRFGYTDSSGEVHYQTAKHQALLEVFMVSVRRDPASGDKYRVVALACQPEPCSIADPSNLLAEARRAGATMLLYGGIH